jgi:methylmalonyl-CoA/ethylmalonyl-CoA epimerase
MSKAFGILVRLEKIVVNHSKYCSRIHYDHQMDKTRYGYYSIFRRLFSTQKQPLDHGDTTPIKSSSALFAAPQLDSERTKVSPLYKLGKLNHIAIVVQDVQDAAELYRTVWEADVSKPVPHVEMGATVIFVRLENTNIELMEPLGKASPLEKFLAENKSGGIHHICLQVPSIEATMQRLKEYHVNMQTKEPILSDHGRYSIFVDPKDSNGVLIELMEESIANKRLDE